MAKELYLYSGIYSYTAEALISQIEEHKSEDVIIRINTPGGSVFHGWGIIAKMNEYQKSGGKLILKVDGSAMSMGAIMLPFADTVEALDVSQIMLHRADMYVENEQDKDFLATINQDLRKKLSARIDNEKLKKMKGVGIENLFDDEKRIDLFLTAKEAKQIGLVDKIVTLNPKEIEALNDRFFSVAAHADANKVKNHKSILSMTSESLQAENPALYNQIFAAGKAAGVEAEKDRVGAWMAFQDVDAEAVKAGIDSGKVPSAKDMAELSRKAFSANALKDLEKGSAASVITEELAVAKTEKEKSLEASEDKLFGALGLKK